MRSNAPSLRSAAEISIWQMSFRLTLLAVTFMATGYGVLFAVKSVVSLLS